jgi:heme exporter protein B
VTAAPPGFLGTVRLVLAKDLRTELRSKELLVTLMLFGAVLTFIFAFGFANDPATNRKVLPGALWAALLFTGALAIGRTFAREAEADAFTALVLSPADRSAVLLAKMLGNLLLQLVVLALVLPLLAVMLRIDLEGVTGQVVLLLLLGTIGFAVVGTPLAVMAVSARFAEVLLPIVVFPLVVPVLIAGVQGTGVVLGTVIGENPNDFIALMLAFDAFYAVGGLLLFDRMVSE